MCIDLTGIQEKILEEEEHSQHTVSQLAARIPIDSPFKVRTELPTGACPDMGVTYDESHMKIVESGICDINRVLFGDDIKQIRSLLFCLDYYLDPYYKNTLPYEKEVYDSLQKLVISSRNDDVIDDCLQLIGDYCRYPLTIMEQGFENIKDSKKPDARYELNQP